jgi:hypothetical protein
MNWFLTTFGAAGYLLPVNESEYPEPEMKTSNNKHITTSVSNFLIGLLKGIGKLNNFGMALYFSQQLLNSFPITPWDYHVQDSC